MTDPPSREEFRMLQQSVSNIYQRLDAIDQHGTRGVAVLQLQITDLAKDFAAHEEKHERWESQRAAARRWAIALAVAAIAAIDGPMVTILLAK